MSIVSAAKAELKNQTIAGGALSVTATEIDLSDSKTQAGGEARFTATTGGINNSYGVIGVNGNLYFNAISFDNSSGQIWGGSDISLAAINSIDNRAGKIFSYGNLSADASSSSINNTAGGIGAGNDLTVRAGSVLNGGGKMAADRDVSLTAAALTGSGEVISGRDLTLNLTGLFINEAGGLLKANNNLTLNLTATGSVVNDGVISAVENLAVSGGSLLNETGATMEAYNIDLNLVDTVVNRGLISGAGAVNINTGAFSNYKTVFADVFTARADSILNEGDSAILGATSLINLYAKNTLTNKDGATIYSLGDINIAGSSRKDASGNYLDKAVDVLNQSAVIEAERDVAVYANQITNKKREFETAEVLKSSTPKSIITTWVEWHYTENVYETEITKDSDPGKILAGCDMTLKAGTITNDLSTIAAGGNIAFYTGTLNNIGRERIRRTERDGFRRDWSKREVCSGCNDLGWGRCCHTELVYTDTPYHDPTTEQLPGYTATFTANQTIHGNAVTINNTPVNPDGSPIGSISSTLPPGTVTPTPPGGANQKSPGTFALPKNGLYHIYTDPGRKYLVETDPRFTDYRNFLSSDYFFKMISSNPEYVQKRLGDGFYEQQLILDQVVQLTGRRFLDGYSDNETQFKALMDSAYQYAKEFNLTVGISLTAEQMAKLTSDIVWMEEQTVEGQKVLAPVVYLSKVHADNLSPAGTLIAAKDINLNVTGDMNNSGKIKSDNSSVITAANIINRGGTIEAGGLNQIQAATDIANLSGKIKGGSVSLSAGQDIKNETLSENKTYGAYSTTLIHDTARIESTGDMVVQAGRDVITKGGNITAQGDAAIVAGNNVSFDTVVHNRQAAADSLADTSTKHVLSQVETGGALKITSRNDASFKGTTITAGKDLSVQAGGDIDIKAVKENDFYKIQSNYQNIRTDDDKVRGSAFTAEGDVTIMAAKTGVRNDNKGNVTITGSNITSKNGALRVSADKNITIREETERHESLLETHTTGGGLFFTEKTNTHDRTLKVLAKNSALSGKSVVIESGGDLSSGSGNVVGTGGVTLTAKNSVTITTAKDITEEEHTSTKSGGFSGAVIADILTGGNYGLITGDQQVAGDFWTFVNPGLITTKNVFNAKNVYDVLDAVSDPLLNPGMTYLLNTAGSVANKGTQADGAPWAGWKMDTIGTLVGGYYGPGGAAIGSGVASKWNNRSNEEAIPKAAEDAMSNWAFGYADSLTYGWFGFHIKPGYYWDTYLKP
jgi:filamentous hemagglutinin